MLHYRMIILEQRAALRFIKLLPINKYEQRRSQVHKNQRNLSRAVTTRGNSFHSMDWVAENSGRYSLVFKPGLALRKTFHFLLSEYLWN